MDQIQRKFVDKQTKKHLYPQKKTFWAYSRHWFMQNRFIFFLSLSNIPSSMHWSKNVEKKYCQKSIGRGISIQISNASLFFFFFCINFIDYFDWIAIFSWFSMEHFSNQYTRGGWRKTTAKNSLNVWGTSHKTQAINSSMNTCFLCVSFGRSHYFTSICGDPHTGIPWHKIEWINKLEEFQMYSRIWQVLLNFVICLVLLIVFVFVHV